MIPTIEIGVDGVVETLYTDEIDLYEIGVVNNVRRASNVNFNEKEQIWEVVDAITGTIVYTNKNRASAIEWEIQNFSPGGNFFKGKDLR